MKSKSKTIDDRIVEKAARKATADMDALIGQARTLFKSHVPRDVLIVHMGLKTDSTDVTLNNTFASLRKVFMITQLERYIEAERAAFMKRLDQLEEFLGDDQ